MEQYIVIAKRLEAGKDKFEDYRIQKFVESVVPTSPPIVSPPIVSPPVVSPPVEPPAQPIPVGFEQVHGPASLDDCVNFIKERSAVQPVPPEPPKDKEKDDTEHNYKDKRWFWVSVGQNLILGVVVFTLIYLLYYGLSKYFLISGNIKSDDHNRNIITYLITFGTIFIGVLAALTAVVIREKERFALVKDVFTVLVGLLGTIIGFYYGQVANRNNDPRITVSEPKFEPATLARNAPANVKFTISGGKAPYHFIMTFPDAPGMNMEKDSGNGQISESFTTNIPDGVTSLDYVIEGTESENGTFKYVSPKEVPVQ